MKRALFVTLLSAFFLFSYGQTVKTIEVTTAGTLETFYNNIEFGGQLKIVGHLNAKDFSFIKHFWADSLDISEVIIDAYEGDEGPGEDYFRNIKITSYPANEIPCMAFRGNRSILTLLLPTSITSIGDEAFQGSFLYGKLVIPEGVTSIGSWVFTSSYGLSEIELPNSVTSIGQNAFNGCNIRSIILPNALETVQTGTFSFCSEVDTIYIPPSVKRIESNAFSTSEICKDIFIPASVTEIDKDAFRDCSGVLKIDNANPNYSAIDGVLFNKDQTVLLRYPTTKAGSYTFPQTVKIVGDGAFANCRKLTGELKIPSTVERIESNAFTFCDGITGDLVIPESVKYIGENAFSYCFRINGKLVLPSSITQILPRTFWQNSNLSGNLVLPQKLVSIGREAFTNCSNLKGDLILPSSLKAIDSDAFNGCTNLTGNLILPDSLKVLGDQAFANCKNIDGNITLPNSIDSIGYSPFNGCGEIITFSTLIKSPEDAYFASTLFEGIDFRRFMVTVPEGTLEKYRSVAPWNQVLNMHEEVSILNLSSGDLNNRLNESDYANIIAIRISGEIDARDFRFLRDSLTNLASLNIFDVKINSYTGTDGTLSQYTVYPEAEIPSSAMFNPISLAGKTNLKSITIPRSVNHIGRRAFKDCKSLSGVFRLSEDTKIVAEESFQNCKSLSFVYLPKTIISIEDKSFSGCNGLSRDMELPDSLFNLGRGAFEDCTGFYNLIIPKYITKIENSVFKNTGLNTVIFSNDLVEIGDSAFYNCRFNYEKIILPSGLKKIGSFSFYKIFYPRGVIFPSSITTIGDFAFANSSYLESIEINATSSLSIGEGAFRNGQYVSTIDISAPEVSLGKYAFSNNERLRRVTRLPNLLGDTLPTGSFAECENLYECTLSSSIVSFGDSAFFNCRELILPIDQFKSLKSIGIASFYNCSGLKSLYCSPTVSSIGNYAFYYCSNISDVRLSNGITYLGDYIFYDCYNLKQLQFPSSLTHIGNYTFYGCNKISSLKLPASLKSIGENSFRNCSSISEDLVFPATLEKIGDGAFSYCNNIKSITLPKSLKVIESHSFEYCYSLADTLVIPSETTTIGEFSFNGCEKINYMHLPKSVTKIGTQAFSNCFGLQEIYIENPNPIDLTGSPQVFYGVETDSCELIVPKDAFEKYKNANQWHDFYVLTKSMKPENITINLVSGKNMINIFGANETYSVSIIDMLGNRVLSKQLKGDATFSLETLSAGNYIIVLKAPEGEVSKLIVKK